MASNNPIKEKLKKLSPALYSMYRHIKDASIRKQILTDQRAFVEKEYYKHMGRRLDLSKPFESMTYTEKIQWAKFSLTDPVYTICADKVKVRDWIKENYGSDEMLMGGWLNFPKWYGVYNSPDEIDYEKLPQSFVLKTNHASGQVLIVEDKDKLNKKKADKQLREWLATNFYEVVGEIHYRDIKPMIICEELLKQDMIDYRIFCFQGEPYVTKVTDRDTKNDYMHPVHNTYFNDWTKVPFKWEKNYDLADFKKPDNFELMLDIARKLASDFEFVRVDLYEMDSKVFFGELTFTPNSGFENLLDNEWNRKLGQMMGNYVRRKN